MFCLFYVHIRSGLNTCQYSGYCHEMFYVLSCVYNVTVRLMGTAVVCMLQMHNTGRLNGCLQYSLKCSSSIGPRHIHEVSFNATPSI